MNILITGVHGFVGSNLVKYLSSNNQIYGLDIVAPEKEGVVRTYSWDDTKFGASPPSFTAENPVVFSEHHHPKTLKTL